jgi:uncharacterized protein Yka (UPF0111/DUF47 family)
MVSTETQKLAERIASLLESTDISSLSAEIEKINSRLDVLERTPQTSLYNSQSTHPSLDKLNIAEAIADSIFGSQAKEKACTFEPSKPCDHCSMCNSRGF